MKLQIRNKIAILISITAVVLALLHLLFPNLKIDAVTVLLLVVSVIPWLSPLFKSIELPGESKFNTKTLRREKKR